MKLLRDPTWQFVAVVVAIIALAATVIIYVSGRPVKRLQVQVLSNSPLVSVNADISPQIQILFKDRPVQALSLILLRFENTGTEAVRESDYSEPIRLTLSSKAEVGEATVQESRPRGISLTPTVILGNQIELSKALLNAGDQVVLRLLALNNDGTLKVTARIAGISELKIISALDVSNQRDPANLSRAAAITLLLVLMLVLMAAVLWNSRRVMAWRQARFGFDAASYYYSQAQEVLLGKAITVELMNTAIGHLRRAFSWDRGYVDRAEVDPLFEQLREYEKFRVVLDRHRRR